MYQLEVGDGRNNQQWKLIRDGDPVDNKWKLQNQQLYNNQHHLLSRQAHHHDRRLVGVTAIADATFVIQQIPGPSERYRILHNALAVTLITGGGPGEGVHGIEPADQVHDLDADGPPTALQTAENDKRVPKHHAQLWSFVPVAQLPMEDGIYRIVSKTGLVLDLTANNDVHGLESRHGVNQKWIVTKDQNSDCYTFESSRVAGRFLASPPGAAPTNDTALSGRVVGEAARFSIRKVPGTQLYKIFFDSLVATDQSARGLAVNLVTLDTPGAVALKSQTAGAQTQTWSFI